LTRPPVRPGPGSFVLGLVLAIVAGCGGSEVPDTAPAPLAEGRAAGVPWRLEGRRHAGQPCISLLFAGAAQSTPERCGIRRTSLRHLEPITARVGDRLLVFSPLAGGARRVRLDAADGSIRLEPARQEPGFPGRFFVADLDPGLAPVVVRAFAGGGRAVVT